jgi:hypothetical protein
VGRPEHRAPLPDPGAHGPRRLRHQVRGEPGRPPDKTRYTLSPAGRRELEGWATSAWVRTSGFRDELFLKLFGAARLGPESLSAFVATQRQTYLSELGGLTRQRREHSADPMIALLIDAAIAHTKADLELLDTAPSRLVATAVRPAAASEGHARSAESG